MYFSSLRNTYYVKTTKNQSKNDYKFVKYTDKAIEYVFLNQNIKFIEYKIINLFTKEVKNIREEINNGKI